MSLPAEVEWKMSDLICIRHPRYEGGHAPDLSCKTCCSIFIERIKTEQADRKARRAERAAARRKKKSQ